MLDICTTFRVTEEDYQKLDDLFGKLVKDIGWKLLRRNSRNNHTDEIEDIFQDIEIAMLRATSYYKRQVFIEKCLELCLQYAPEKGERLNNIWKNKVKHGASKQKFTTSHEIELFELTKQNVPSELQPSINQPLEVSTHFSNYCKSIMWNEGKAKGKKITREKPLRSRQVSIHEFDYLGSNSL